MFHTPILPLASHLQATYLSRFLRICLLEDLLRKQANIGLLAASTVIHILRYHSHNFIVQIVIKIMRFVKRYVHCADISGKWY
jgi:hypothetical protein